MKRNIINRIIKTMIITLVVLFGLSKFTIPVYATEGDNGVEETFVGGNSEQKQQEETSDNKSPTNDNTEKTPKKEETKEKDSKEDNQKQEESKDQDLGDTEKQEEKKSQGSEDVNSQGNQPKEEHNQTDTPKDEKKDDVNDTNSSKDDIVEKGSTDEKEPTSNPDKDQIGDDVGKDEQGELAGKQSQEKKDDLLTDVNPNENKDDKKDTAIEEPEEIKNEQENSDGESAINNNDDIKEEVNNTKKSPSRNSTPPTANLTSYITNVEIAAQVVDGAYVVQPNVPYEVTMYFAETDEHQFLDDLSGGPLTYTLPQGFNKVNTSGTFTMEIVTGDGKVVVENNQYTIVNSVVYVTWSTTDPDVASLFHVSDANFYIKFWGSFEEGCEELKFNDAVIIPLKMDDVESSIKMQKTSAEPVITNNATTEPYRIQYEIKIVSTGINTNVNLNDVLTGNGVQLDSSSFKVLPAGFTNYTITVDENDSNKFYFHADRLTDGQTITIQYSAILDERFSEISGQGENKKFYINADNVARITTDGEDEIPPEETHNEIVFKPTINKVGRTIDGNHILWHITINANNKLLIKDMPVVDLINPNSAGDMFYNLEYDKEIIVKIYDKDGTEVREEHISLAQILNASKTGWTYVIPSDDNFYRYEIEYTTSYNNFEFDTTLVNDVHIDHSETHGSVEIPGTDDISLEKAATNVNIDDLEITWEITIDVPKNGLSSVNNTLTDTYPAKYLDDGRLVVEAIKNNSIVVKGLIENETYDVTFGDRAATFTFYKDANHTPGLIGTGERREIIIELKTNINQEWLNGTLGDNSDNFVIHENTITMGKKTKVGDATVVLKRIVKSLEQAGTSSTNRTIVINGVTYPYYKYKVMFSLIDDDVFTLEDTFDTSLFDIYTSTPAAEGLTYDDSLLIKAGDRADNLYIINWQTMKRVDYVKTTSGLKFTIHSDDLMKDANGNLHNYYGFYYYLIPKNYEALTTLMQLAAQNKGTYDFNNKIKYKDELEANATGTYYYSAINKKQTSEFNEETGTMDFEIEINPNAIVLNNGNTMTLTDSYNNLSILYDTIEITSSDEIVYYPDGNNLIFTIPDSTSVTIKYTARILYNVDENSYVHYQNIATLIAGETTYESKVIDKQKIKSTGGGGGGLYSIKLLKYEYGNMSNKLAGAVFELLDASKNPILDKNRQPVTFTTGSNGIAIIEGQQDTDGWALKLETYYHLHEILAPPGFQKTDTYYKFKIAKDGNPNYDQYIYFNGDVLTVRNRRGTEFEIEVLKELIGREWTNDDSFEFTLTAADGTPLPTTTTITITKDNNEYKGSFGKIRVTEEGIYTYTITETHQGQTINGLVYDQGNKEVVFVVIKNEQGHLVVSPSENTTYGVTFTNTYNATGQAEIKVEKKLEGREWKDNDSFKFELTGLEGAPLPEKTEITITKTSANYIESFGKINYTKAGTYKYKIREIHEQTTANGITYDTTIKDVTFTLVDDGNGNLVAAEGTSVLAIETFTNEYTPKGEAEISVLKNLVGREWNNNDSFEFTITAADGTPLPANTTIIITKDNAGHKGNFGKITFTKAGTYTYTITETHKGQTINGIVYDSEDKKVEFTLVDDGNGNLVLSPSGTAAFEVTFTNEYSTKGEAEISVLKNLVGREWNNNDSFTFTITASNGTPLPANTTITITKDSAGYKGSFGKIEFTKAGKYTYTITETHKGQTINGIVYDSEDKKVEFTLVDDGNGNLVLSPSGTAAFEVTFENTYNADGEVVFSGEKKLTGRKVKEGEFLFQLYDSTGKLIETVTNDADGKFTFKKISYTEADLDKDINGNYKETTKTYTIKEVVGEDTNITYDTTEYEFTVTLKDNGNGKIVVTSNQDLAKFDFINTYKTKGEIVFSGEKVLKGRKVKEGEFSFQLYDSTGELIETVTNDADGKFAFSKLTFTEENLDEDTNGNYIETTMKYIIKEVIGKDTNITYDDTVYEFEIKLNDNGEGKIIVTLNPEDIKFSFINEYHTHVSVSKVDLADGKEVEGAKIQVLDKDGEIVDEWTSTKKAHVIEGLTANVEYTLKEILAPEGYTITNDIKFIIDENGEVTTTGSVTTDENGEPVILIQDKKTIVRITKVDITTGKELPGAHLQVIDSKGNVIEEWTSTKETHIIEGLKVGEEYTLKETVAPDGYIITGETTFTIDKFGKVTTTGKTTTDSENNTVLLVENQKTIVRITKVDITTGEELAGAKLQVLDKNGKVVEEWVSTKETHIIEGLKVNEEYTLKEIVAPLGYEITGETRFIIDEFGKVTTTGKTTKDNEGNAILLIQDDKIPDTPPSENPKTADYYDIYLILEILFSLGFIGSVAYLYKSRKVEC